MTDVRTRIRHPTYRQILDSEVFISMHPERYGLDDNIYDEVVVLQEKNDGRVIKVVGVKNDKTARRVVRQIKEEYGMT